MTYQDKITIYARRPSSLYCRIQDGRQRAACDLIPRTEASVIRHFPVVHAFMGCEVSATGFLIGRHETTVHRLGKRVGGQPYGLSAKLINCMLASQHLPPLVRSKLIEYAEEGIAGFYGGTTAQRARFAASLANVSDRQSIRRLRGDRTEIIIWAIRLPSTTDNLVWAITGT